MWTAHWGRHACKYTYSYFMRELYKNYFTNLTKSSIICEFTLSVFLVYEAVNMCREYSVEGG